jgi:hypothetical protein
MPTTKEIFALRKTDKQKAYELAIELINSYPNDIWNKRAYAWTIYDQINIAVLNKNFEKAKSLFTDFENLQIPDNEEEKLIYENFKRIKTHTDPTWEIVQKAKEESEKKNHKIALDLLLPLSINGNKEIKDKCAWEIFRVIKETVKKTDYEVNYISELLNHYFSFELDKPSLLHSLILEQTLKIDEKHLKRFDLSLFYNKWQIPSDFRTEDYEPNEFEGKKLMPLTEKAFYSYIKMLINKKDKDLINNVLPIIDKTILEHPEYNWLQYFKGKLLIAISSDIEKIKETLFPFIRQKSNEFWAWSLLSEIYKDDDDLALSFLCKSLTCNGKDEFLVKVRQSLANLLIKKNLLPQAKFEINKIIEIKKSNEQHIPYEIQDLTSNKWYAETELIQSNFKFYTNNSEIAEDLVYEDIAQKHVGIVEFINKEKGIAYFLIDKQIKGNFKTKRFKLKFQVGNIYEFKIQEQNGETEKFYKVLSLKETTNKPNQEMIKEFSGILNLNGKTFGFIDNIFISPDLITNEKIIENSTIKGIAIYSFDKKKNKYGWRAVKITEKQK